MIRGFFWSLVAVMSLQGFLQADEYGTAPTMFGGMGLTMSVWTEWISSFWSSSASSFVALPRVIVLTALQETARHPGIQVAPKLQEQIRINQRIWDQFREKELSWMLAHVNLIGGIVNDPEARELWTVWYDRLDRSETALALAKGRVCSVRFLAPTYCGGVDADVRACEDEVSVAVVAVDVWRRIREMDRRLVTQEWWEAIRRPLSRPQPQPQTAIFQDIADRLARLHDIEDVGDPRLVLLLENVTTAVGILAASEHIWIQRLLGSLMNGDVWTGCMEHVRLREGRIREIMMSSGFQDMIHAHEKVLNASLRVVSTDEEKRLVQEWFSEMAGYAWFPPDDVPALVRRCVGQEGGDCTRIGPTEINALTAQYVEKTKILTDWTRRVFVGLWNGMPIVLLLFFMELVVLCVGRTRMRGPMIDDAKYAIVPQ